MRFVLRFLLSAGCALLCFALPRVVTAQQAASSNTPALVIHLERLVAGHAIPMHADHVFSNGDIVRFRVSSRMNGYLYVIDQGSSGQDTVLFPAADTQDANQIRTDADYFVPTSGDGWFEVGGPAGFDTVYFLLSPAALHVSAAAPPAAAAPGHAPASMLPRCNDAVFKARGECVDPTAGPAALPRGAVLPPQIQAAAPGASRDITLVDENDGSVAVSVPAGAPVVYAFRLAHH